MSVVNRAAIARDRAGLSVGQAAKLLGIDRDELLRLEQHDSAFADADHAKLAELYGVRVEWLTGEAERYDYASIDRIGGADKLTSNDRKTLAEFAASMPRRKS